MRLVHTNTKIPFANPYVCIVLYREFFNASTSHSTLCRKTYKTMHGTWGYSNLYPGNSINTSYYAYFCFKEESDLLSFMLTCYEKTSKAYMWPDSLFTVHEIVEKE